MSGNVNEWCSDWYSKDYYESSNNFMNPIGPSKGTKRVYRGGSSEVYGSSRVSARYSYGINMIGYYLGFRLVSN